MDICVCVCVCVRAYVCVCASSSAEPKALSKSERIDETLMNTATIRFFMLPLSPIP